MFPDVADEDVADHDRGEDWLVELGGVVQPAVLLRDQGQRPAVHPGEVGLVVSLHQGQVRRQANSLHDGGFQHPGGLAGDSLYVGEEELEVLRLHTEGVVGAGTRQVVVQRVQQASEHHLVAVVHSHHPVHELPDCAHVELLAALPVQGGPHQVVVSGCGQLQPPLVQSALDTVDRPVGRLGVALADEQLQSPPQSNPGVTRAGPHGPADHRVQPVQPHDVEGVSVPGGSVLIFHCPGMCPVFIKPDELPGDVEDVRGGARLHVDPDIRFEKFPVQVGKSLPNSFSQHRLEQGQSGGQVVGDRLGRYWVDKQPAQAHHHLHHHPQLDHHHLSDLGPLSTRSHSSALVSGAAKVTLCSPDLQNSFT